MMSNGIILLLCCLVISTKSFAQHQAEQRKQIQHIQRSVQSILRGASKSEAELQSHGMTATNSVNAMLICTNILHNINASRATNTGIHARDTRKMKQSAQYLRNQVSIAEGLMRMDQDRVRMIKQAEYEAWASKNPVQAQIRRANQQVAWAQYEADTAKNEAEEARREADMAKMEAEAARIEAARQRQEADWQRIR
ncbi:MAG: hypothetical protein KBA51_06220 [Kiritimatiellae bacterium]|nr:hypothetical protein [Kiritimatiellia bacterium]